MSFLLSLTSLLVTAAFNEMGTESTFVTEQEEAEWERFRQEYPTKDIYTMDELNSRDAEIGRIQDKYRHEHYKHYSNEIQGHLFFRDTAIRSLKINLCIWLAIPALLGYPVRSVLAIAIFPIAFSAVGLFYAFEIFAFVASYILGAFCGVTWIKLKKRNNDTRK